MSQISFLGPSSDFQHLFFTSASREPCLRFFIKGLVFILYKISGNFLDIFKTLFSISDKIKTRA